MKNLTEAAEQHADKKIHSPLKQQKEWCKEDFKAGAEYGYNEAMKWISVDERLPENDDFILLYDGEILKGYYVPSSKMFWDENADNKINATHWLPLPNPPKQ